MDSRPANWREVAAQASREQDSEKLISLARQLVKMLDERLHHNTPHIVKQEDHSTPASRSHSV
jgi:hypothetical protein